MFDARNNTNQLKFKKRELINFLYPDLTDKKDDEIDDKYYLASEKYCMKLTGISLVLLVNGRQNESFAIFSYVSWSYTDEYITVRFSEKILSLLTRLKREFTQCPVEILKELTSVYAIRGYEYFKMKIQKNTKDISWTEDVNIFKKIMNTENKYARFTTLRFKLLEPIIEEINEKSDIQVQWEPIMSVKKIITFKFTGKLNLSRLKSRDSYEQSILKNKKIDQILQTKE